MADKHVMLVEGPDDWIHVLQHLLTRARDRPSEIKYRLTRQGDYRPRSETADRNSISFFKAR